MNEFELFKQHHLGILNQGASENEIQRLQASVNHCPNEVLEMYRLFNGDRCQMGLDVNQQSACSLFVGVTLYSIDDCLDAYATILDMIQEDETLPEAFYTFVPIASTELKTELGLLNVNGEIKVIEYHFETGVFTLWADSLIDFIALSNVSVQSHSVMAGPGLIFPHIGKEQMDIDDCFE